MKVASLARGGIAIGEFARRRRRLLAMIGTDDAAVVVPAAPQRTRNGDVTWPYRQDSDFHYLCGFPEPDAVLVLLPGRQQGEVILFCRERDPAAERLEGARVGTEQAAALLGLDDAFPIDDVDDILPGMLEGRSRIYGPQGRHPEWDGRLLSWATSLRDVPDAPTTGVELMSLGPVLHELRLIKSAAELKLMQRAAQVTVTAHVAALAVIDVDRFEYDVEAAWRHVLRQAGLEAAFLPCVASGTHACIAHYRDNGGPMRAGDMVLIDAGAEVGYYAADMSRTVPVTGRFSARQRTLYDIVWAAQRAALDQVQPGLPFDAAHAAAVKVLVRGLRDLGLLRGSEDAVLESGAYKRFFPYKTGHWLGLDVHDVGDYRVDGESRMLEAGMALTVEPGIYIQPDEPDVPEDWRGIGIRIEDDVVVTAGGHEVLTGNMPSEASAIEALMAGG